MYHHYLALDWAKSNMALARMTKGSNQIVSYEGRSDLGDLRAYLANLRGPKILAIEETTIAAAKQNIRFVIPVKTGIQEVTLDSYFLLLRGQISQE